MAIQINKDIVLGRLLSDKRVKADNVQVSVRDGTVTLKGTVPSLVDKTFASGIVHYIHGVRKVNNKLQVRFPEITH